MQTLQKILLSTALAFGVIAAPLVSEVTTAAPASAETLRGQGVANIAWSKLGSGYRYGAAGPNIFDCSGFTSWVYRQVGIAIPRTARAQYAGLPHVRMDQLQNGDLVFYRNLRHAAIYIGNGRVVSASNPRAGVANRSLAGYSLAARP